MNHGNKTKIWKPYQITKSIIALIIAGHKGYKITNGTKYVFTNLKWGTVVTDIWHRTEKWLQENSKHYFLKTLILGVLKKQERQISLEF